MVLRETTVSKRIPDNPVAATSHTVKKGQRASIILLPRFSRECFSLRIGQLNATRVSFFEVGPFCIVIIIERNSHRYKSVLVVFSCWKLEDERFFCIKLNIQDPNVFRSPIDRRNTKK